MLGWAKRKEQFFMNTTITDSMFVPDRRASGMRHIRYWTSVFGLAVADGMSFLLAHVLFRAGNSVPSVALFMGSPPRPGSSPIDVFLLLAAFFIAVRYLSGDYSRRQLFWDGAKATTIAVLVASLPDLLMTMLGGMAYEKLPVILSWTSMLIFVPLLRQAARVLMTQAGIWQIPTAMIGIGPRTSEIATALNGSLSLGFNVRWLVIEDSSHKVPEGLRGIAAIHSSDAARTASIICKAGCKEAVVAAEDMQSAHFAEVVQRLLEVNIPVAIIPSLNRLPLAGATTNYFFGQDLMMLQVRSNVQRLPWRIVKRSFDIVVSIILLILLSPLFVALSIAIKRFDGGKATYFQRRVGRRGVEFKCYKFRSMVPDAEARLTAWQAENSALYQQFMQNMKLKDDPRVTPIGSFMRRTSLDELPQLWNVLRGDMSLVGPRPVVTRELEEFYGPAATLYLRTRPGMTGLWQVSGRSDASYSQRVILDEWYILNWSFWYDIVILIQTAWIVIARKGAF
jgi:undecaprenyl-phosphate galactose phosphotransferase